MPRVSGKLRRYGRLGWRHHGPIVSRGTLRPDHRCSAALHQHAELFSGSTVEWVRTLACDESENEYNNLAIQCTQILNLCAESGGKQLLVRNDNYSIYRSSA